MMKTSQFLEESNVDDSQFSKKRSKLRGEEQPKEFVYQGLDK